MAPALRRIRHEKESRTSHGTASALLLRGAVYLEDIDGVTLTVSSCFLAITSNASDRHTYNYRATSSIICGLTREACSKRAYKIVQEVRAIGRRYR